MIATATIATIAMIVTASTIVALAANSFFPSPFGPRPYLN